MEKITYGVPRLVDWVAQIRAGAATVRVHFTGGALTSYGVTPAEYTTDNPFIQKVIEQSSYFKDGRIIVVRRTTLPDAEKSTKAKAQTTQKVETEELPTETHTPKEDETTEDKCSNDETLDGVTTVEVSCLQDAQAYLQEHFNISSYKVRTYEAAQRVASEHGVEFVGAKFGTTDSGTESESATGEE